MVNSDIKFCVRCKHFERGHPLDPRAQFCKAPQAEASYNLVSGFPQHRLASNMRENGTCCGYSARWFEPIPSPSLSRPRWAFWRTA